jgi:L-amino acid N-acyltransferase YncA
MVTVACNDVGGDAVFAKEHLHVREVCLDDVDAIVALLNPIIETGCYTVLDTPVTVESEREFIAHFPARGIFHVAERRSDGKVVGVQTVEPYRGYTHAFDHVGEIGTFVDLAERHKGIGRRLADVAFEAARRKGYEKLYTVVRADNEQALGFYLSLSFCVVDKAKKQAKIGNRSIDEAVALWRTLQSSARS